MFAVQQKFFRKVEHDLHIGLHKQAGTEINMVQCINHMAFGDLGKFRLIDDKSFGEEFRYYVKDDGKFEELQNRLEQLDYRIKDFNQIKLLKSKVGEQLRRMAGDIVAIRLPENRRDSAPAYDAEAIDIRKLSEPDDYSTTTGLKVSGTSANIIYF